MTIVIGVPKSLMDLSGVVSHFYVKYGVTKSFELLREDFVLQVQFLFLHSLER